MASSPIRLAVGATTPSAASATPSPSRKLSLGQHFLFRVKDQRNPLPLLHPRPALRIRRNVNGLQLATILFLYLMPLRESDKEFALILYEILK